MPVSDTRHPLHTATASAGETPAAGLLLFRSACFSPNSEANDAAILRAVADRLAAPVQLLSEDELPLSADRRYKLILSMGRRPGTLAWLKEQETKGTRVLNPPLGVELCCHRSRLAALMADNDIPQPPATGRHGYWLKRADTSAQSAGDIRFCAGQRELAAALADFGRRGIADHLVQAHVQGDLVKFYGVLGTGFFRHYYPGDDGITKMGDEMRNGTPHHYTFAPADLQSAAGRLADLAAVPVYGGDAIIRPDGTFVIIDFNDWPSFARCREAAAGAIVDLATHR
ncbi:ATP-grasp domain-containing protein [Prevotella dentasini]